MGKKALRQLVQEEELKEEPTATDRTLSNLLTVEGYTQEPRVDRTTCSEVAVGEQEFIVEQTTCSEVGGQELIVEQSTSREVVIGGGQELIVEQTTCSEVEVREQELSKPKLMRQETLGMGRTENSRFRNKNFEFTDDDPVQMKVFTPIMNLVVKTTYESDEAFKAAMEKRRRGLKLKRSEEAEEGLNFTLHVTQTHINLVAKALGQVVQEEPTTATRSLGNLVKPTARNEVKAGGQVPRVNKTTRSEVAVGERELIVEQTTCSEVEVREQELSKPKLMRQETLGMGRTENSRFRNKNFEFTDDDPVQMKVF